MFFLLPNCRFFCLQIRTFNPIFALFNRMLSLLMAIKACTFTLSLSLSAFVELSHI
nr:MAG TPA: hypothetical protein [Caudoviricetes sp.]